MKKTVIPKKVVMRTDTLSEQTQVTKKQTGKAGVTNGKNTNLTGKNNTPDTKNKFKPGLVNPNVTNTKDSKLSNTLNSSTRLASIVTQKIKEDVKTVEVNDTSDSIKPISKPKSNVIQEDKVPLSKVAFNVLNTGTPMFNIPVFKVR